MDEDVSEDQANKSQSDSKKENPSSKKSESEDVDMEAGMDDKVWSEVSKDIGELLREVEDGEEGEETGNKSSDDEEDTRTTGRRYDRFKHSEKGKAGKVEDSENKSVDETKVKAEVVNGDDDKEDA